MSKKEISEHARALARRGAAKGGRKRAANMSPEERSENARRAAQARWGGPSIPQATHTGELEIASRQLSCAVLENGKRLFTQEGFLMAIGRSAKAKGGTGGLALVDGLPPFLAAANLKPFISMKLQESTTPIIFRAPKGGRAYGYDAELLPMVCEVYLKARDAGEILPTQSHIVDQCDLIMRGLAHVGIIALVDEATGYQEIRDRIALQKILEKYITDEWAKWTKTFPDEFYRELFRLKGLQYPVPDGRKPLYVGHWTNNIVYSRLAPGVLKALRVRNPVTETGHRKRKHHQHLTRDLGHPVLTEHLSNVTFLMKTCRSWPEFERRLNRAIPKYGDTMPLDLGSDDED